MSRRGARRGGGAKRPKQHRTEAPTPSATRGAGRWGGWWRRCWDPSRRAVLLGLIAFLVYNSNLRMMGTGDSLPARFLPFAILGHGTLRLDPVLSAVRSDHPGAYWIVRARGGGHVSGYPIITPLLVTPLYLPAVTWVKHRGWQEVDLRRAAFVMEKLAASAVAAVSVALAFVLLRRRLSVRQATWLTVAFAFGTSTWVISSQALWQHGAGQLLLIACLLLVTGEQRDSGRWLVLGALLALVAANRPPDVVLGLPIGVYALWRGRWKPAVALLSGAAVVAALVLAYNLWSVNHWIGGYSSLGATAGTFFSGSWQSGVAGLLVSPAKGLFVFSPFFAVLVVLAIGALVRARGRGPFAALDLWLLLGIGANIALYSMTDWRAGSSWGTRFLTDLLPLLIWILAPALAAAGRLAAAIFGGLVVAAIAFHAVGAYRYQGGSDGLYYTDDAAAWKWRHTAWIHDYSAGMAPWNLLEYGAGWPREQTYPRYWYGRIVGSTAGSTTGNSR